MADADHQVTLAQEETGRQQPVTNQVVVGEMPLLRKDN